MGSGPDLLAPDSAGTARANVQAALTLLEALRIRGLRHLVLCPGSRSAPLAVAAALLESRGLRLHTAIDERSAAFFALGLGRGLGMPAAVVTTSGTAVAQLLAAAVEADLGTIPLLLLSADRPEVLKNCGANQAVPQEHFLVASCRRLLQGPLQGLAGCPRQALEALAAEAMTVALGDGVAAPAGPVHLNLAFAEPLHVDGEALAALQSDLVSQPAALPDGPGGTGLPMAVSAGETAPGSGIAARAVSPTCPPLDPTRPGVVVAGPWRGTAAQWPAHVAALIRWQRHSGWPVLADVLSGLRGLPDLEVVAAYDPLLEEPPEALAVNQVLRLGSLPASRRLQRWLTACGGRQVLVSQGDPRRLDPLGTVAPADQWSAGLASWVAAVLPAEATPASQRMLPPACRNAAALWRSLESVAQAELNRELPMPHRPPSGGDGTGGAAEPDLNEPWLARALSRLLPRELPVMLASSSPVRDWESFADRRTAWRAVHGFRGASGIDGTLSIACGLAEACGQLVLVTGDLALLHDANGWLWTRQLRGRLCVVLIENGGGGIFEQLPIRTQGPARLDFERLFAMPQNVDQLALAALHGVPGRRLARASELDAALAWALDQPCAVLEVRTDRRADALRRQRLRRQIAAVVAASPGTMDHRDAQWP